MRKALFGGLVFFATCFFTGISLQAQVIYRDIQPDVHLTGWEVYSLLVGDTGASVNIGRYEIWKHPDEVVLNTYDFSGNTQVLVNASDQVLALNQGASINAASGTWKSPSYYVLNSNGAGPWVNAMDKYIGLRFKKNGNWYYGWARLDIDATPTYYTLKDAAYHAGAGQAILAGEKGTTGISSIPQAGEIQIRGSRFFYQGKEEGLALSVVNTLGQLIFRQQLQGGEADLSWLPAGIYIFQLQGEHLSLSRKVCLSR